VGSPSTDVTRQPNSSADVREPPTLEPTPPRLRPWLRRSGVSTIPTGGCSPCASDCTGRLNVGMTRDFADREASGAAPSHTCGTSGVRHSVRRGGILLGRARGAGSLAHPARGPRRNITGPQSFTGPLFDRPHAPRLRNASIAPIRFCKKSATPNHGKNKASPHRH
jgi:hypothetical protein